MSQKENMRESLTTLRKNIHTRGQKENTVYKADVNVKTEQEAILLFRTVFICHLWHCIATVKYER